MRATKRLTKTGKVYFASPQGTQLAKICSTCKQMKPTTEYYRYYDGFQNNCKTCEKKLHSTPEHRMKSLVWMGRVQRRYKERSDRQVREDQKEFRPDGTKPCSKCKKQLPLDNFKKNRAHRDGLYPSCKSCAKKRMV